MGKFRTLIGQKKIYKKAEIKDSQRNFVADF